MSYSLPTSRLRTLGAGLLFALLLLAPAAAYAQGMGGGAMGAQQQPDMQELRLNLIAAQLDLTDTQRGEVQTILSDQRAQQEQISQQYRQRAQNADSSAMQAMQQEMQSDMEETRTAVQTRLSDVLDAGQMEAYRTIYVEPREEMQEDDQASPEEGERVDMILDRRTAELDLSEEQRAELRPVYEQQLQQMQQLRQQAQQARGDEQQMQQLQQQAQQMQQETQQQLQAVLTEEQMQKMQAIQQAQQALQQAQQRMRRQQMQQMRQQMQQQGGGNGGQ